MQVGYVAGVPIPDFVVELRRHLGQSRLWLPAVTAVVVHEGRLLMVRRADNGAWTPITGIMEPGEEPAVAAVREAHEETGVRVRADRLAQVTSGHEVTHANGDLAVYLDLTFACSYVSGEAHVADDESSDVRWWPLDALPQMSAVLTGRVEAALSDESAARYVG